VCVICLGGAECVEHFRKNGIRDQAARSERLYRDINGNMVQQYIIF
jgi:hypothetical protein